MIRMRLSQILGAFLALRLFLSCLGQHSRKGSEIETDRIPHVEPHKPSEYFDIRPQHLNHDRLLQALH